MAGCVRARSQLPVRTFASLPARAQHPTGWTQSQEEVLDQLGIRDKWLVLAQYVEEEDRLRVQRTWLWGRETDRDRALRTFVTEQAWWIEDYSLFRAIHAREQERPWTEWPEKLQRREPLAIDCARRELAREVLFHQYLQWLAATQWRAAIHRGGHGAARAGPCRHRQSLSCSRLKPIPGSSRGPGTGSPFGFRGTIY